MTRKECLDAAAGCVLHDRANDYGGPEDNFGRIARLWSDYIGVKLDGIDVAMMMALLKIARIRNNKAYEDGYIDLAGYAACGAELAGKAEAEAKDETQPKYRPGDSLLVTMPEGEDVHCVYIGESTHPGCCCVRYESGDLNGETDDTVPIDQIRREPAPKAEGCEEQAFQVGEHVQYRIAEPSEGARWLDAWYLERLPNGRGHIVKSKSEGRIAVDPDKIRKAPKAEGCEALVEKDAPQTPAELYDKIIASNPATFGRPRTPTGEELAEMAEEEAHE